MDSLQLKSVVCAGGPGEARRQAEMLVSSLVSPLLSKGMPQKANSLDKRGSGRSSEEASLKTGDDGGEMSEPRANLNNVRMLINDVFVNACSCNVRERHLVLCA